MEYKTMNLDDIINWCVENNQVAWLKAEAKKTKPGEDDKVIKISFIELKRNFALKFMPEIIEVKEKKPSMYDRIANL